MLGLGGSIFTWMLFRHRLVPRFISVIGMIGYAALLIGGIGGWFDAVDAAPGGNGSFIAVPVAVFEIALLPAWLFARGFRAPGAGSEETRISEGESRK
jgi:hypothetical protein